MKGLFGNELITYAQEQMAVLNKEWYSLLGMDYRLIVLGDLNGRKDDGVRERDCSSGVFDENDNEIKVVGFVVRRICFKQFLPTQ